MAIPEEATKATTPVMNVPHGARFHFSGLVGDRIIANQENWLLSAPAVNPGMLQMFRDRDRKPRQPLVPWAGEYAGKYLTSAVECYRLTRDKRLYQVVEQFARDLIAVQDTNGYLGAHPKSERLVGKRCDSEEALWDLWSHYHVMLGLMLWWQESGDAAALTAACRAADFICDFFLDTGVRAISAGAEEMNLALSHGLCLLYSAWEKTPIFHLHTSQKRHCRRCNGLPVQCRGSSRSAEGRKRASASVLCLPKAVTPLVRPPSWHETPLFHAAAFMPLSPARICSRRAPIL